MNILNIPTALSVARKDIKIFLKERGTLLYLFVVPIVFILAFSGVSGAGGTPKKEAIILPVVNLDSGSEGSQALLDALNQGGSIQCELYDEAKAETLLEKGTIKRVLTIPTNYERDLQSGDAVTLRLANASDASFTKTEAVHRVVTGVAADLSLQSQLISSFRQMSDMQAMIAPEQQTFTTEIIVDQAQSQFERSRTEPLLGLEEMWSEHLQSKDEGETNPLDEYIPGFTVLFIFLTGQTTAQSLYDEKKIGSFRRLLAAPISKPTILSGKLAPNFLTGLIQIIVLFGTGVFIAPLLGLEGMAIGNDLLALVVLCLVLLLCSTSLGVLIAGIARTEAQISGISSVVLWIFGFAAIWFDQIAVIPPLDTIGKLIPHTWANGAFLDLFIRGQGLADIMPSILVLLGFTLAFFAVGLWRFDYR
jgi:ABC-2 type transport system permease protein